MAIPLSVGDIIVISKLCLDIATHISEIKKAPIAFQESVQTLLRLSSTFDAIASTLRESEPREASTVTANEANINQRVASEIKCSKDSLQQAAPTLKARCQGHESHKLSTNFRRLWKQSRWPGTRQQFEQQLEQVARSMQRMQLLIEAKSLQTALAIRESVAAIDMELNKRPVQLGVPGSGGSPEQHVKFEDGIRAPTHVPLFICASLQNLHRYLEHIVFDGKCPGQTRIKQRHYKLYCTNFKDPIETSQANWATFVRSGCVLSLAFVVGTWKMSVLNLCPKCKMKNPGGWQSWRDCRCGHSYFVSEAGEVDYEPADGEFFWTENETHVWKDTTPTESNRNSIDLQSRNSNLLTPCTTITAPTATGTSCRGTVREEYYFRRQVFIYDPIFNFVCRNFICRCIIGMTSLNSNGPRLEILSHYPCAKHSVIPLTHKIFEHILDVDLDYEADEYFDKFGGYRKFEAIARWCAEGSIYKSRSTFTSHYALTDAQNIVDSLELSERATIDQYRYEVLGQLSKASAGSDTSSRVNAWLSREQTSLAHVTEHEQKKRAESRADFRSPQENTCIPMLFRGRLAIETMPTYDIESDTDLTLPFDGIPII